MNYPIAAGTSYNKITGPQQQNHLTDQQPTIINDRTPKLKCLEADLILTLTSQTSAAN